MDEDMEVKRLRPAHVEKWMERGNHSPATLRNQLSILRGFCRWLVKRGHMKADPTLDIAAPRQPRYLPRGLPLPKVASALDASPDTRATLILSLMVQEGLRCCEVSSLELGDVDPTERLILVLTPKTPACTAASRSAGAPTPPPPAPAQSARRCG